ncbi:MAG TPA: vWA domain-containing protein [Kofleriaceae bacterium]
MRIREALFALLLAGCADRTIASVTPEQKRVETKDLPSNPDKDVDILFLIDNSGSMLAEQQSLQANFPKFMQVLETLEGGAPNLHIGVVTSDMGQHASDGTGTVAGFGCTGAGDDGAMQTATVVNGRYIIDESIGGGARNRNYSGTLGDAFAAMAAVGVDGCGIEQHLSGVERALQNTTANAGFLRPEAKLAVIVIADEDDCSLAHKTLFEGSNDGAALNFRCTQSGITCTDTPDLTKPGIRNDCQPNDQSQYLEPVDRYVDFIKSLKPNWKDDVIVAGILGKNDPFEIVLNDKQQPILGPSCRYGGDQTAVPALRTADFLEQFTQRVQEPICGADLSKAMVDIGALLKRAFGDPCWEGEVADLDPTTAGLQADCSVVDVRVLPDGSRQEVDPLPNCSTGEIPCWKLVIDDVQCSYTSTHLKLVIDRGGALPASDIHVQASCVTSPPDGGPFM